MLLQLLFLQFFSVSFANPFHKYPYVFLLDIGNEEVQKTAEEQIRLTSPGGSLALRYPAVGDGQTIAHIRVSGIDFGTDLKSNIVEGGPGYKYVVLVFMGNPGVPFDAVVTVQTIASDMDESIADETSDVLTDEVGNGYQVSDQENQVNVSQEQAQESVEVPKYVSNLKIADDYEENNSAEDSSDYIKDIRIPEKADYTQEAENEKQSYIKKNKYDNEERGQTEDENFNISDDIEDENLGVGEKESQSFEGSNLSKEHKIAKLNLYNSEDNNQGLIEEHKSNLSYSEDPNEIDEMFNDEEVHNDGRRYQDDSQNSEDDENDEDVNNYSIAADYKRK